MKMRNEQMYHLRQSAVLTIEDQDLYFENVVTKLFDQIKPDQILLELFTISAYLTFIFLMFCATSPIGILLIFSKIFK
jgi:hypothetical protein